jgi:hypothetical protein
MANRSPATSARLSRYSQIYGGERAASLLREARSQYAPQSTAQAIRQAWEHGRISWPQAQAMAKAKGVSLNG